MKLAIGDFAPDLDTVPPGFMGRNIPSAIQVPLEDMHWLYSTPAGWRSMPQLEVVTLALPGTCTGAFCNNLASGQNFLVLGIPNQLYVVTFFSPPAVALAPVSQGLTLTNPNRRWYFTVYGNDLLATNSIDPVQVSTGGGTFTALGGSPPIFSVIEATDFSVFGLVPASNVVYFTLNDTLWTPNIATETGTFVLGATPGINTACKALRNGVVIYKRNSFYAGYFVGAPFFWQMSKVSGAIGTAGFDSVVATDTNHYFWGVDDFYSFDGQTLTRLPNNLRRWFISNMNGNFESQIRGVYNRAQSQIKWWFSSINASPPGTLDQYISYSLLTGKWDRGYVPIDTPIQGAITSGSQNIVPGTSAILGVVDTTHSAFVANGTYVNYPVLGPFLTTGDLGDKRSIYRITGIRPGFTLLPAAASPQLNAFQKYLQGGTLQNLAGPIGLSPVGSFDMVMAARLTRLQMIWSSDAELSDCDVLIQYAGQQ